VRAIVIHLIAQAEAQASVVEFVRQTMAGRKLMEEIGGTYSVDGMNEAGLRARSHLTPGELSDRWSRVAAEALRFRRGSPVGVLHHPLHKIAAEDFVELDPIPDQPPGRDGLQTFLATVLFPACLTSYG
jgi:hypothetical protein